MTTAESTLTALRGARDAVEREKAHCVNEMAQRTLEGTLWTYGQCERWPAYQEAIKRLETERSKAGT